MPRDLLDNTESKNTGSRDILADTLSKAEGIQNRPPLTDRLKGKAISSLPGTCQFVGGVAGSIVGGRRGKPRRGQIAGGTAGRGLCIMAQKMIQGQPITDTEKKKIGKELLSTLGIESLVAGSSSAIIGGGKGALEALLGKRITERGLKEGFKRFLDPKFYQDRVPKEIVTKTAKFFDKLDIVLGKAVQKAVLAKDAIGRTIKFQPIKQQAKVFLKETGADSIDDLGSPTISQAQRNKLREFTNMVDRVKQDDLKISSVWKIRKKMDKIRFRHQWDPDVQNYMDRVRSLLNEPLKRGNKEIAQSFGRYSGVQDMKRNLEKKFEATLIDGDTFSPNTEQFANNLLGTSKDETVRSLRKLDSFLTNADDKIVEDLLDVAATESLEKTIEFMGIPSRTMIGAIGGKRAIAGGAANFQSPVGKTLRTLVNRGTATGTTNLFNPESVEPSR